MESSRWLAAAAVCAVTRPVMIAELPGIAVTVLSVDGRFLRVKRRSKDDACAG